MIPGGSWVAFFKSARFPPGFGLLFSKVPNSRRGLLYFFQKCPIPAGVCFTFSKSARSPAGLGLLSQKLGEPGCAHFARLVMTMMNQKKAGHMRCLHVLGPFFGACSAPYLNVINRLMYFPMMSNSRLTTVPLTMALKFVRSWV